MDGLALIDILRFYFLLGSRSLSCLKTSITSACYPSKMSSLILVSRLKDMDSKVSLNRTVIYQMKFQLVSLVFLELSDLMLPRALGIFFP